MCTIFSGAKDGEVLIGNNEDFFDPFTQVWYVRPEGAALDGRRFAAGRYGRVYFGYTNVPFFMQGGMNEAGLFFDYTAQTHLEMKKSAGKARHMTDLMDEWMATCSTVQEVLDRIGEIHWGVMENACAFLADGTGGSAIYEGDETIHKQGRTQVGTNFRQSTTPPDEITCSRFKIATEMLEANDEVSVPHFRRVLSAVHQEAGSKTVYSNIYDLSRKLVYLYHFHDFEHVVEVDLAAELENGSRSIYLPDLFPNKYSFEEYVRLVRFGENRGEILEELRADGTIIAGDPATWECYVGHYEFGGHSGASGEVIRAGDRLFWFVTEGRPERPWLELYPTGAARFLGLQAPGNAIYTFEEDASGGVTRLSVDVAGFTIPFDRVPDG